ncbi:MAG: glycosyltransferase family 2 protein, partial [Chloroflexi bacterium]
MNLNQNNKVTNPTVSVIIPSYNYANFLPEAVESIFNQTFQDFEVIVVDDGSTDNTQEVVQTFMVRDRFHYIYQENQGLAATRNTGLRAAKGDFVAFLDADDIILPNKLEVQVNWLRNNPDFGLVGSGYYYMDEHGVPIEEQRPWLRSPHLKIEDLLFDCPFIVHAILVKKEWVDKVGGFDKRVRRVEDWDL